jgi:hypothetical protein
MVQDLNKRIDTLHNGCLNRNTGRVLPVQAFSTESGLADFRGPDGLWTRKEKGLPVKSIDFSGASPMKDIWQSTSFSRQENWHSLFHRSGQPATEIGNTPGKLAELHGNVTQVTLQELRIAMDNF